MQIFIKSFYKLAPLELYKVLRLREQVFIIEQNCPYDDLDNHDQEAIHVWIEDEGEVVAVARVLPKNTKAELVSIGRVVTGKRGEGLGKQIMLKAIEVAKKEFNPDKIYIEAQKYAEGFYNKVGFKRTADEEFLLDDIWHIKMILTL